MTETHKVYDAIRSVMLEIGEQGISKDRNNAQQGYKFRGIDDIYNALNPVLARNSLVIMPRVLSSSQTERMSSKGNTLIYTTLTVQFKIVSSEDGSSDTIVTVGEAMDSADKSSNKAMAAAYKYAAMMLFCIPTEGDNDADATTHELSPPPLMPTAFTPTKTATRGEKDILCKEIDNITRVIDLEAWGGNPENTARIRALNADLQDVVRNSYVEKMSELKGKAVA